MGPDRAAIAQNVEQLMRTGLAERHYIAGTKERVDQVSQQRATITDCAGRTITTLDLRAKTYRIAPIESPAAAANGGGNGGGTGGGRDAEARIAITVTNTALGSRELAGQPTSGYRSNMTFTETDSSGQSQTQSGDLVGYYSSYEEPSTTCARLRSGSEGGAHGMDMVAGYQRLMQALSASGDSRFSVKQSGPPLPLGKLAMYSAMSFAGQAHQASFVTERGNVRPIAADDPIFMVPSDFTQQQ